jgi:hypothetical protein
MAAERDTDATRKAKCHRYQTSPLAFDSAIPWFESRRPSQRVRSPSDVSVLQKASDASAR